MSSASTVPYTSVYTDSEPGRIFWGADEELSDGGSPRVIVYGYDRLPMQPVAPPSPDYVLGPEHHLHLPREDILEAELPPRKRLCLTTLTLRYEGGRVRLLPLHLLEVIERIMGFNGTMDTNIRTSLPPLVDRMKDIPEAELPPYKRLCLTALTSRYEVGESLTAAPRPTGGHGIDYGLIGTLDAETRR
ncbi:hypothetical protein Tco_0650125 [Tanacetum coccineum]